MFEQLNEAIVAYRAAWQRLLAGRKNRAFFERLQPIAATWKMAETTELDKWTTALRGECDQIHFAWLDERWLGMLHLRERQLGGISA